MEGSVKYKLQGYADLSYADNSSFFGWIYYFFHEFILWVISQVQWMSLGLALVAYANGRLSRSPNLEFWPISGNDYLLLYSVLIIARSTIRSRNTFIW
jgi:hypothetical protein